MKPFTIIAALIFFFVAAAHAYRAYAGWPVTLGGHDIPMWGSYVAAVVSAFLGVMLISESRR
ncbi:MAG TPA: hypothetical protein VMH86_07515 [Rhizomicrobium sp.]|nr:hypothetical protein [Rhizomicrobium sp.]